MGWGSDFQPYGACHYVGYSCHRIAPVLHVVAGPARYTQCITDCQDGERGISLSKQ